MSLDFTLKKKYSWKHISNLFRNTFLSTVFAGVLLIMWGQILLLHEPNLQEWEFNPVSYLHF